MGAGTVNCVDGLVAPPAFDSCFSFHGKN